VSLSLRIHPRPEIGKSVEAGTYSAWQLGPGLDPTDFDHGLQFQPPAAVATARAFRQSRVQTRVPGLAAVVVGLED
jgi:hypothetical protein